MVYIESLSTNINCTPTPRAVSAPLFLALQIYRARPGHLEGNKPPSVGPCSRTMPRLLQMAVLGGGAFSYEQGTPVTPALPSVFSGSVSTVQCALKRLLYLSLFGPPNLLRPGSFPLKSGQVCTAAPGNEPQNSQPT